MLKENLEIRDTVSGESTAMLPLEPIAPLPAFSNIPGLSGGGDTANNVLNPGIGVPVTATHHADPSKESVDDGTARAELLPDRTLPAIVIHNGFAVKLRTRLPSKPRDVDFELLIASVREAWNQRNTLMQQRVSTELRAQAFCRALCLGDKDEAAALYKAVLSGEEHPHACVAEPVVSAMLSANERPRAAQSLIENSLAKMVKQLPGIKFVTESKGIGLVTFAGIVGEAGDLSNYSNPGKLWKRMGLGVHTDGKRQRRVKGVNAEEAMAIGYVARRRSLMWNMGASLLRANGPLRSLYDDRKPYELAKCEAIAADPELRKHWGSQEGNYAPVKHAHDRAKRYMEKRILLYLWVAWKRERGQLANEARAEFAPLP
jgi:hypothetical protein